MNMMKRWPVFALIALAVVLLASPALIGRLAERNIEQGLSLADLANENISISAESFHRGWFTSEGRHRIELTGGALLDIVEKYFDGDPQNGTPAIVIETRLDHGPIPVSSMQRERGSLHPGLANAVSTLALDPGNGEFVTLPAKIYGFFGLGGGSTYRALVDEGSFAFVDTGDDMETEVKSVWGGGDVTWSVSADGLEQRIAGSIEPATFSVASGRVQENFGRIEFSVKRDRHAHRLGETELTIDIDSLSMILPYAADAGAEPLHIGFRNEIDDGRSSGGGEFSASLYGVHDIGELATTVAFRFADLDADALASVVDAYRIVNGLDDAANGSDPAFGYALLERSVETLAASGGRFRMENARLTVPAGEATLTALTLDIDATEQDQNAAFSWPSVLLNTRASLDATLSASLVDSMLQEIPEFRAVVAGGFLVRTADGYGIKAELEDGRLLLNGAPMSLPIGLPR